MKNRSLALVAALAALAPTPAAQDVDDPLAPDGWSVLGLELPCGDVERTASFYAAVLGWEVARLDERGAILQHGAGYLALDPARPRTRERAPGSEHRAAVYANHRVADLEAAALAVEANGGVMIDSRPVPFVLGHSMGYLDPSGNYGHLVGLAAEPEPAALPQVFNLSVRAPGLEALEALFVEELGFSAFSRAYLPRTLPLEPRGAMAIVVHPTEASPAPVPASSAALLMRAPAAALEGSPPHSRLLGPRVVLAGPGGFEIVGIAPDAIRRALAAAD